MTISSLVTMAVNNPGMMIPIEFDTISSAGNLKRRFHGNGHMYTRGEYLVISGTNGYITTMKILSDTAQFLSQKFSKLVLRTEVYEIAYAKA